MLGIDGVGTRMRPRDSSKGTKCYQPVGVTVITRTAHIIPFPAKLVANASVPCTHCHYQAKSWADLNAHIRIEHCPPAPRVWRHNATAHRTLDRKRHS